MPGHPGMMGFPGGMPPGGMYTNASGSYGGLAPQHQEQLQAFWGEQMREIQQTQADPAEFKNSQLPLARIKKIMKSDEDVRMISAEAPVLFAKACEMFILELTLRSWYHAEENKRRTLQRNDVAAAITRTDIFDFLIDIVPQEELKAEGQEGAAASGQMGLPPGMQVPGQGMPGGGMPPGMYYPGGMGMDPSMMGMPPGFNPQMMMGMPGQMWGQGGMPMGGNMTGIGMQPQQPQPDASG